MSAAGGEQVCVRASQEPQQNGGSGLPSRRAVPSPGQPPWARAGALTETPVHSPSLTPTPELHLPGTVSITAADCACLGFRPDREGHSLSGCGDQFITHTRASEGTKGSCHSG